jgi:guanylate kinase
MVTDMLEPLTADSFSRPESYETIRGRVFILSGPSGVGKDSLTNELKRQRFPLGYCITATTRRPRESEVDGVHYLFMDVPAFEKMRESDELLEWAVVHDNNYGIPRWQVREGLRQGDDIMITVDVQGGETLRRKLPGAVFIFLAPPTIDELLPRLLKRGTETPEEVAKRLRNAHREMEYWPRYDYMVRNHSERLSEAVEAIKAIIIAERHRVNPRLVTL